MFGQICVYLLIWVSLQCVYIDSFSVSLIALIFDAICWILLATKQDKPMTVIALLNAVFLNVSLSLAYNWLGDQPFTWSGIWLFPIASTIAGVVFYYTHRILHIPIIYKYIHYVHHENRKPEVMSTFHTHPIELCFNNLLPILIPMYILNVDAPTMCAFALVAKLNAYLAHAADPPKWVKDICMTDNFHHIHHQMTDINFGFSDNILDRLHGTAMSSSAY